MKPAGAGRLPPRVEVGFFLFRSVCFFPAAPIAGCILPLPPFLRQHSHPAVSPSLCLPPFTPSSSSHQGVAVLGCSFTARQSRLSWELTAPAPPPLQSQGIQASLSLSAPSGLLYSASPAPPSHPALQDKQHHSHRLRAGDGEGC